MEARLPSFLEKTFDLVGNPETDSLISWSSSGTSFIIWDHNKFSAEILPKHFRSSNFSSFVSQLNNYGFKKVTYARYEYANEWFQSGKKHLLENIKRKTQEPRMANKRGPAAALVYDSVTTPVETKLNAMMTEQNGMKQQIQFLKHSLENMAQQVKSFQANQFILPELEDDDSPNREDYQNKLIKLLQDRRDQSGCNNTEKAKADAANAAGSSNQDQTVEKSSENAAHFGFWTNMLMNEDEGMKDDEAAQRAKAMMILDEMMESEFATGKEILIAKASDLNLDEDGQIELWA